MSDTIIYGPEFDVNVVMYSSPKANPQGGKNVNILNKTTKSKLRIQTPLMLTWGAGEYVDEKTGIGNGKFDMALQFPNDEFASPETDEFLKTMTAFQNKIKTDALANSKEWFGKIHKSAEIIDELFSPMIKFPNFKGTREPDYSKKPSLKVKVPLWEGTWKCEVYDEDGNPLFPNPNKEITPLDFIKKGSNVAVIIQFGGIWFINGNFGVSWQLVQAVVQKPKADLTGKCYIRLKKTEKDKLVADAPPPVELAETKEESTLVDDSDEEEEDEPQYSAEKVDEVQSQLPTQSAQEVVPVPEVKDAKKKPAARRKV